MNDAFNNYKIGYGKPPKGRPFQPGQSGNPKGRPKGSKNTAQVLQQELEAKTVITENGARKRLPKRQIVFKQLVNKAAAGDARAIALLLQELRFREGNDAKMEPAIAALIPEEDQLVMQSIVSRLSRTCSPEETSLPSPKPSITPTDKGENNE